MKIITLVSILVLILFIYGCCSNKECYEYKVCSSWEDIEDNNLKTGLETRIFFSEPTTNGGGGAYQKIITQQCTNYTTKYKCE